MFDLYHKWLHGEIDSATKSLMNFMLILWCC